MLTKFAAVVRTVRRLVRCLHRPPSNAVCLCGRNALDAIVGYHAGCPGCVEYVSKRLDAKRAYSPNAGRTGPGARAAGDGYGAASGCGSVK